MEKKTNTAYIKFDIELPGFIPIGMVGENLCYVNKEKDLTHEDINGRVSVDYYRPVSKERLDDYREDMREYYRDLWAEAGKDGRTDLSLDNYIEEECDTDLDNPEWYPSWDEGVADNVNYDPELRRVADLYASAKTREAVGTWEWGGYGYIEAPFDVVFSHPEFAERLEREAGFRE